MKKILIAIPCMDYLDVRFVESLILLRSTKYQLIVSLLPSSLIYHARNNLAKKAMELECEYILWLDSDMSFKPDVLDRLLEDIEGKDFVTGLYFSRKPPFKPCIFERNRVSIEGEEVKADTEYCTHIPDEIFEIEGCGFGCVLVRTEVIRNIYKDQGLPFSPVLGFGEDLSFCLRARNQGYSLYCDPTIILGHTAHVVIGDESLKKQWNETPHKEEK